MLRFRVLRGRALRIDLRLVGQATENYYVYGEPTELEVPSILDNGRPTPYFGAVGRFKVDAALIGTVRVGESVKLTLTVRGRGNFEFLRLPSPPNRRLPQAGANEAQRDANQAVITYDLTPPGRRRRARDRVELLRHTPGGASRCRSPLALAVQPLAGEGLAPLPELVRSGHGRRRRHL